MTVALDYPRLKFPLTKDDIDSLQMWIDQMKALLNAKVAFSRNMDGEVIWFEFASGTSPTCPTSSTSRPSGVMLLSLQQIVPASNTAPTVADSFSWSFAAGTLTFPSLGTLAAGTRYRAAVLVVRS